MAKKALVMKAQKQPKYKCRRTRGASVVAGHARSTRGSGCAASASAAWSTTEKYRESRRRAGDSMTMTDPIADMLARVRNASSAMHDDVSIPASKLKESIAHILLDEGFISGVETVTENGHPSIKIRLKYSEERDRAIAGIRRVSTPGRRVYKGSRELPRVLGGLEQNAELATPNPTENPRQPPAIPS